MRRRKRKKTVQAPSPWLLHVFMSFPTAIALAILAFSYSQLRRAQASETWPTVPGVIEEAGGRRGPPVYRYEVRGETYRGWRTVFSSGGRQRFDKGDAVAVHVNPEDPRETVLYPGWTWRSLAMPAFGALVLLVATGICGRERGLCSRAIDRAGAPCGHRRRKKQAEAIAFRR